MPWPTPMHMAASPRRTPRRRISWMSVPTMRAPEQPSGWPSAMAPPLTLTCVARDRQLAQAGEHLRGERLVELDELDVRRATSRPAPAPCASPAPGRCPCSADRRRPPRRRRRAPAASSPCLRARSSEQTSSAAAPSLSVEELPAVTLPPGRNAGSRRASFSSVESLRGPSSGRSARPSGRLALGAGQVDGEQLVGEAPGLLRRDRLLVRLEREAILLGAGDAVLLGEVLGRLAHRLERKQLLHLVVGKAPAERGVEDASRCRSATASATWA